MIYKYLDSVLICPEEEKIGDSKNIANAIKKELGVGDGQTER